MHNLAGSLMILHLTHWRIQGRANPAMAPIAKIGACPPPHFEIGMVHFWYCITFRGALKSNVVHRKNKF